MKIDDIKKINLKENDILLIECQDITSEGIVRMKDMISKLINNKFLINPIKDKISFKTLNIKSNKDMLKDLIKECILELNNVN